MVYNINVNTGLFLGVYVWNGTVWTYLTDNKTATPMTVATQPKAFSFYQTGKESIADVEALTFGVNAPMEDDGSGTGSMVAVPVKYQWFQIVGGNVHARVGDTIRGATEVSYNPYPVVIKGTTLNANNAGFYRFYCEAKADNGAILISDIAEVAVGCGAKNTQGEWLSFMCFNLGADIDMTIEKQKTHLMASYEYDAISGLHPYSAGEEKVWGDLYQWGRIADGHEKRSADGMTLKAHISNVGLDNDLHIVSGKRCSATDVGRPYLQIGKTDANGNNNAWYGKFITTTNPHNWHPDLDQNTLNALWRAGRFVHNDPCAHFKENGDMQEFWHEGADLQEDDSQACVDAGTAWRTPQQEEWGAIYKGGGISGTSATATANTWEYYRKQGGNTGLTLTRGFEIKPDGVTTTLFLPASGLRDVAGGALLYRQGVNGFYWSTGTVGTNSYNMNFSGGTVNNAHANLRAYGFALRCIKHN